MQLPTWIRSLFGGTPSPARLTSGVPVVREKPLHEQYQRIGGGLTPADVSYILAQADAGQPERLIDLGNESRQKDGHLQGVMATRDMAVSLYPLEFMVPEDAPADMLKARDLCEQIVGSFDNFRGLIKHLSRSYFPGHATAIIRWRKVGGQVLPVGWSPVHPRDMIFSQDTGQLRYRVRPGDLYGIDLLEEFPGRVIQLQRSVVGDAQPREGLIRILVWMALLRNWDLRDWVALAEIGWKPWRLAMYKAGATDEDVDRVVSMLEEIGSTGVGAFPETSEPRIEWPKSSGGVQGGQHRELFDALGREISKAVLGQTTSTESGTHGTRSDTQTRDQIRKDIGEDDALAVAAALHSQLFAVAVAVNLGPNVELPATWFQTEEPADRKSFAEAIEKLQTAGLRIPAQWVRDEVGMPQPKDDDEILGEVEQDDDGDGGQGNDSQPPGEQDQEEGEKAHGVRIKALEDRDGPEYASDVSDAQQAAAAREMAPLIGTLRSLIAEQDLDPGADDRTKFLRLRDALVESYQDEPAPTKLADNVFAGLMAARLSGMAAVRQEDGGLEPDEEG